MIHHRGKVIIVLVLLVVVGVGTLLYQITRTQPQPLPSFQLQMPITPVQEATGSLVAISSKDLIAYMDAGHIKIVQAADELKGNPHPISVAADAADDLKWSPDGSMLAAAGPGGIRIWNWNAGTLTQKVSFPGAPGFHEYLAWSPDSSRIAYVGAGAQIIVATLKGSKNAVWCGTDERSVYAIAWSGEHLATIKRAGSEGTLSIWKISSGSSCTLGTSYETNGDKVVWSPDGRQLAVANASFARLQFFTLQGNALVLITAYRFPQELNDHINAIVWQASLAVGLANGKVLVLEVGGGVVTKTLILQLSSKSMISSLSSNSNLGIGYWATCQDEKCETWLF